LTKEVHLIGGCGSSGSTLLAWLLDGSHDLRSGPETGLFHHRELYTATDFPAALRGCLEDEAWTRSLVVNRLKVPLVPRVFFMDREFHGLGEPDSPRRILEAGQSMDALVNFVLTQFAQKHAIDSPVAWVDQTPKNCVAALEFLQWRPQARFIHLLRDGRDVMLSLARRWAREAPGHPPSTYLGAACARWTFDVVQARRASDQPGYLEVTYEDLVHHPLRTLNRILEHLKRPAISQSLLDQHQSPSAAAAGERFHGGRKQTWGAQPGQAIQTTGVGRWKKQLPGPLLDKLSPLVFDVPGDDHRYCFGEQLQACGYV
jgi:hypothetical protein